MLKLLLTHTPHMRRHYYGDRALAGLSDLVEVRLHEQEEPLGAADLIAAAKDADIILADRNTPGPAEIFAALPGLKAMLRCAVDIRNIDVEAASAAGVLVTRATPGFVASVCELALGYLVDLSRGVGRAAASYHAGNVPTAIMGRQLAGSTLGIIGYGAIGRQMAPLGLALGMKILVTDPYATVEDARLAQVSLDDLLTQSDYVLCLAVANEATENLMNAAAFARMKPSAYFLNLSRGGLVDEAALAEALGDGTIAGAALDVGRAPDQMPTPDLAKLPNVIATPHIGGLTPPAIEHQALDTVEQVRALVRGEIPPGAVNHARWTRRPSV